MSTIARLTLAVSIAIAAWGSVWAGSLSLVPQEHWGYAALDELARAGCFENNGDIPGGELTNYEFAQRVVSLTNRWGKIEASVSPDQVARLRTLVERLIEEFADSLKLFNVSPQSLHDRMLPVNPGASVTENQGNAAPPLEDKPTVSSPVSHKTLLRVSSSDILGFAPLDSPFAEFSLRIRPETLMRQILSPEQKVETSSTFESLLVRNTFVTTEPERISSVDPNDPEPLVTVSRDTYSTRLFRPTPGILNTEIVLPLTDSLRIMATYSRAVGDDTRNRFSGWEAGARYSPGRLAVGASVQSLDEDMFQRLFLGDSETYGDPLQGVGRVQGIAGYLGYRWGPFDLAGRLEGYESDSPFGILMRYSGQVAYRGLSNRFALGLTLTRSFSVRPSVYDALNASFGIGYAITRAAQLQLTYGLRDNLLETDPGNMTDRTRILAGRLSVSF